uniref:Ig-like domain-containing protein n=1 Tax=Cyprinus carpio TaxID=7962 RepID=A0A8C1WY61_CYPCA
MGSSALLLKLLLMSLIYFELSQGETTVSGITQVKPVVKVTPDQRVLRGENVTLTCDIQGGGNIQWTYSWFKDGSVIPDITERVYTITSVSDNSKYSCEAKSISDAVTLTVSDSPTSTLTVTPDSPVFTGERVSLKCEIESYSNWRYEWRYEWYKGSVMLQTSERYTVNTDTLTITAVTTSDAGQFWCRGQRDKRPNSSQSSSVSLTVKESPRSTLTVTPDSPVFTGERVSLKCEIESNSDWRYEWNKDGTKVSERHTVNRNTLTIERSKTSDAGVYTCRGHIDRRSVSSQSSSAVYLSVKGEFNIIVIINKPI